MGIKTARYINIKYCTNCRDPHIVLLDDDGEPYAEVILSGEHGQNFIEALKQALYRSAVEKSDA